MASSADLCEDEEPCAKRPHLEIDENRLMKEELFQVELLSFPPEILHHVVAFLDFSCISKLRLVCRTFNNVCRDILLKELKRLTSDRERKKYIDYFDQLYYKNCKSTITFARLSLFKYAMNCLRFVLYLMEYPHDHRRCRFDAGKVIERAKALFKCAGPADVPLKEILEQAGGSDVFMEGLREIDRFGPYALSMDWESVDGVKLRCLKERAESD